MNYVGIDIHKRYSVCATQDEQGAGAAAVQLSVWDERTRLFAAAGVAPTRWHTLREDLALLELLNGQIKERARTERAGRRL
jgi:hypothetical protein